MTWIKIAQVVPIASSALAVDQVTKWAILLHVMRPPRLIEITPFLNLTLGFNSGISFGVFHEAVAAHWEIFAIVNLCIVVGLIVWAVRTSVPAERFSLAVIAGGALGNVVDRFRQGAVTDFLDFHWGAWHWPAFNMADAFIALGVAWLLLSNLWVVGEGKAKGPS